MQKLAETCIKRPVFATMLILALMVLGLDAYRKLVYGTPGFTDYFFAATPIREIAELNIGAPAFVFSTTHTEQHASDIAELIAPQGRFGFIDDPKALDVMLFKRKAVSIHHELMFTRSLYGTPDMDEQGKILNSLAVLVDDGKIRTTLTEKLSPINAANLKTVHALIESGAAKGKIVLEGF